MQAVLVHEFDLILQFIGLGLLQCPVQHHWERVGGRTRGQSIVLNEKKSSIWQSCVNLRNKKSFVPHLCIVSVYLVV